MGINLEIRRGETVLISGENGAGKSTLLRVVAGLMPVHHGEVRILGASLAAISSRERRRLRNACAYAGHDTGVITELTVREYLTYAMRLHGMKGSCPQSALETVGLRNDLLDECCGHLSEGQRRRVGLAIALSKQSDVVLLDEPFVALDQTARVAVLDALHQAQRRGAALVWSSHDHVGELADSSRHVVLAGGCIVHDASLEREHLLGESHATY